MGFTGFTIWTVAGLIGGSAGILLFLQRLRVYPKPLQVPTLLFWSQAIDKPRARTLFERFRHPLTYAILLLIMILLAIALGQPKWTDGYKNMITAVIVLDAGMSMNASIDEGSKTRLDRAREEVLRVTEGFTKEDRVAIIVSDPLPRLVHRFEDSSVLIKKQLAELKPAETPSERQEAVALATSLLNGQPNPRLVLITDHPMNANDKIQVIYVGIPKANAAILAADYGLDKILRVRAGYWGKEPKDIKLEVQREDNTVISVPTQTLSLGATKEYLVNGLQSDGSLVRLNLIADDSVLSDNRMTFHLPDRHSILVRTNVSLPKSLLSALESNPLIEIVKKGSLTRDMDIIGGDVAVGIDHPTIVITDSATTTSSNQTIRTSYPDLDFEGVEIANAKGLDVHKGGLSPLLWAGKTVLAGITSVRGIPVLYLSSSLFTDDVQVSRRSAFAVFFNRAIYALLNRNDDPIVISANRVQSDPLWGQRTDHRGWLNIVSGNREKSNLMIDNISRKHNDSIAQNRRMTLAGYELLLLLGTLIFVYEGVLHARGRIS
jgi:hypothetical protein